MGLQGTWTVLVGLFVATFAYLAYAVNPAFIWGDVALGLILAQSAVTGVCPLKSALKAAGLK